MLRFFSQINLGLNDFQMLMMVLNDNLLEGQHGKYLLVTNVFGLKNFFQVSVIWFHTLDALPQNGDTWKGSSSYISQGILGNSVYFC